MRRSRYMCVKLGESPPVRRKNRSGSPDQRSMLPVELSPRRCLYRWSPLTHRNGEQGPGCAGRCSAQPESEPDLWHPFSSDLNGYPIADRIKNGRILLSQRAKFLQLLVSDVGLDSELHANFLKAVPNVLVEAEEATDVDIAINR